MDARGMQGKGETSADAVLVTYYGGGAVPCPVGCGGEAEAVRVRTTAAGAGEIWLECGSCAQRSRHTAPRASTAEVEEVRRMVEAGREPTCPRHARRVQLGRRGRQLICSACGVRFRE